MTALAVVVAAGLGSYLLRISMVLALGRREAPGWLNRVSSLVAPAAFAALVATAFAGRATDEGSLGLVAAGIAAVVAVRISRSANAALLVGLPTMWLVTALTG